MRKPRERDREKGRESALFAGYYYNNRAKRSA